MINQDNVVLRIDISKKSFDVALLLLNGIRINKKFRNNHNGFNELQDWLEQFEISSQHAYQVATNNYGHALAEFLLVCGYSMGMVNQAQVKGFAQSLVRCVN